MTTEQRALQLLSVCRCRPEGTPADRPIPTALWDMVDSKEITMSAVVELASQLEISERELKRQRKAYKSK